MRILLLCHAFNSLAQRVFVELGEQGHEVSVEFDINDATSIEAVELFEPDLIIAPFLKRALPEVMWKNHLCLIVHPGIVGDRGPSSLDWAILNGVDRWGVTVLQADADMDAGDIWASVEFPMRDASKGSLYRNEVTEAALEAIGLALQRFRQQGFKPLPLAEADAEDRWQPLLQQAQRRIDWQRDDTATVLRKIRSADGFPGLRDNHFGRELSLYNARAEPGLRGSPGEMIATSDDAICIATTDGAVWIGHLKDAQAEHAFKLPATRVLAAVIDGLPYIEAGETAACREIDCRVFDGVAYLEFNFHNGAMSTQQCERLTAALAEIKRDPSVRIVVLLGGEDFWSNGIHLNHIEAAASAADESWRNINAIDDLALEIIDSGQQWIVSALRANAGAGGVFLARAADEVWARQGVILNPHYKDMGNLYGSEYWSYLLPRHAGAKNAQRITQARLPMGSREALRLGLIDRVFENSRDTFADAVRANCTAMLGDSASRELLQRRLAQKRRRRAADEAQKPLAEYRCEELERMQRNFYGFDPSYHIARYNFVYKIRKSRTPHTIARHRRSADRLRKVS